jgi:hypothetical protein
MVSQGQILELIKDDLMVIGAQLTDKAQGEKLTLVGISLVVACIFWLPAEARTSPLVVSTSRVPTPHSTGCLGTSHVSIFALLLLYQLHAHFRCTTSVVFFAFFKKLGLVPAVHVILHKTP